MRICQSCGEKILSDNWDYCRKCGTEILRPGRAFIYEQLFELMKLQDNRRQHLDSKAHTYIGLLSIAVTIIVALGGLTIENIIIRQLLSSNNISILSVLYFSTVLLFTISVIVAFHAYHIGSPIIKENSDRENISQNIDAECITDEKTKEDFEKPTKMPENTLEVYKETVDTTSKSKSSKKVYLRLYEKPLVENSDEGLMFLQKNMIPILGTIISENQKFNIQKSNSIIYAYYITIAAIISLLLLCVIILLSIYEITII
ncbi:MAG: hypothetical protein SRB1_01144 [Desulfobacteraceae bacterium Eth-SRB1]|nr:MAG: hypothetical protein SRB1_01144 [Desulfobacteraceae bacterium Eth-SRB1]